nr:lasso peptide biosynthesis PqqD family chaperone [Kibdelosporangium phytohabitans]
MTSTADGAVLLDERTSRFWQLNPTGYTVLRTLLDGGDHDQVVGLLQTSSDVDPSQISADIADVVDQLCAAQLVVRR